MAFNDYLNNNFAAETVPLTGITAGSVGAGKTLLMSRVSPGSLSALCEFTAATSTITLTPVWQVSNDGQVWVDATPSNGAAQVAQATGTSAAVTRAVSAPDAVYGWRYARIAARVGVVTGGASDSATMGYCFSGAPAI